MTHQRFLPTVLALTFGFGSVVRVASAQETQQAAAEALFQEGKRLMDAGDYDAACPMFADSQRAEPAVGTQLNLGLCYKRAGLTASAWATYKSAAASARDARQTTRAEHARAEAVALEPKLQFLVLDLSAIGHPSALEIRIDSALIPASLLARRIPVDPGSRIIEASATGYSTWRGTVDVRGPETNISLPALKLAPVESSDEGSAEQPPNPLLTWAWVSYGVGAAGVGVGILGLLGADAARDRIADATRCVPGSRCEDPVSDRDSEATYTAIAWTGFIVGGLGIATGTTLLVLPGAEAEDPPALEAYIAPTSLGIRGAF